jgi:hypothetical protein
VWWRRRRAAVGGDATSHSARDERDDIAGDRPPDDIARDDHTGDHRTYDAAHDRCRGDHEPDDRTYGDHRAASPSAMDGQQLRAWCLPPGVLGELVGSVRSLPRRTRRR